MQKAEQQGAQRRAFDPQEEFIHTDLPKAQRLGQRDLKTARPGASLAPLVPVTRIKRGEEVSAF